MGELSTKKDNKCVATRIGYLEKFNHSDHSDYRTFGEVFDEVTGKPLRKGLNEFKFTNSNWEFSLFSEADVLTVNVPYRDIKKAFRERMESLDIEPVSICRNFAYPADAIEEFLMSYFKAVEESTEGRTESYVFNYDGIMEEDDDAEEGVNFNEALSMVSMLSRHLKS